MRVWKFIKDAGPGVVAAFLIGAIALTIISTGLLVMVNLVLFK